jgi:hypothetical protein
MVNRYAGACGTCGGEVPANGGVIEARRLGPKVRGWVVRHTACAEAGEPAVMTIRTAGGTFIRNARGRCEDAPCCGCCTI